VLDQLDGGVALLDQHECVVFWNGWLAAASGRSVASLMGVNLFDALNQCEPGLTAETHGEAGGRLRSAVADALGAGASALLSYNLNRAILPLRARDGSPLLHAASVKPLAAGGERFCLIQITDVSMPRPTPSSPPIRKAASCG
jgi:hypothetical protein